MIPAIGKNPDVNTLKSRLPGGRAFMPSVSLKRLTKVWQEEPAGKTKQVPEACHRRKEGRSIRGTARGMGLACSTVRDWLVRMHAGGLNRRFERRRAGRKRTLTGAILKHIKRWLNGSPQTYGFEAGSWQINMVQEMLRERFGISCRVRTLKRMLGRLGFSYSKPRPIPDKSASKAEQEEFKRETARLLEEMTRQGHVVQVCDEAAVQIWSGVGYGWRPAGRHDTVRHGFSKKSVRLFGSLGTDGYRIRTTDAINSETFIAFLQEMLKAYPKFVMILDNASCHKSKMVAEFVDSTDGAIRLAFLPPYTPQLNPIEMQWAVLKRLLSGRYFRSVEKLKKTIITLVDNGEMKPVRLMSYLTP